jgi:hypothetical protein
MKCHGTKKVEKMMAILLDTQLILLCGKSLIEDMSDLLVILAMCGLVKQVMVLTHMVI